MKETYSFQQGWPRWMWICIPFALVIFWLVSKYGGFGRGRAAGLCAAVGFTVLMIRWEDKSQSSLWLALLISIIIQAIVIVSFSWGQQSMPAFTLLPSAIAIYLFDEGLIYLFNKVANNFGPK